MFRRKPAICKSDLTFSTYHYSSDNIATLTCSIVFIFYYILNIINIYFNHLIIVRSSAFGLININ